MCLFFFYLLKLLVLLHVFPGGVTRTLRLFLEGQVGGHERGLLGKEADQTSQQPGDTEEEQTGRTCLERETCMCGVSAS